MSRAIVLIDGEHHPGVVAAALGELATEHEIVAVAFCGGSEKVGPETLAAGRDSYGYELTLGDSPAGALRAALAASDAELVIDLADEPRVDTRVKLQLAALAGAAGLAYRGAGLSIEPPDLPELAVGLPLTAIIGTGKRTGKTAVCGHLARLLVAAGQHPAIVSMGRGGPAEPVVAGPETALADLVALSAAGLHAASDYLEDAVIANVPAVGCRRVGGGPSGRAWSTNFAAGVRLAAGLANVDCLLLEGSGATLPPARADATICVVGSAEQALELDGPLRLALADLVLLAPFAGDIEAQVAQLTDARVVRFELRPTPTEPIPAAARVAFFSTGPGELSGATPLVTSRNLADRSALAADLEQAAAEGCTHYATEIKAAAIDLVAAAAAEAGAQVVFVRNEPVNDHDGIDEILVDIHSQARARAA